MTRYRLRQDKERGAIWITRQTLLGERKLKVFTDYHAAMEYIKQTAAANRPSRVSSINTKGEVTRQWDYGRLPTPKVYENKPRKLR